MNVSQPRTEHKDERILGRFRFLLIDYLKKRSVFPFGLRIFSAFIQTIVTQHCTPHIGLFIR